MRNNEGSKYIFNFPHPSHTVPLVSLKFVCCTAVMQMVAMTACILDTSTLQPFRRLCWRSGQVWLRCRTLTDMVRHICQHDFLFYIILSILLLICQIVILVLVLCIYRIIIKDALNCKLRIDLSDIFVRIITAPTSS